MMTWFALKAINFYQKFISPYKGFRCAHGVATGEISCSWYGKKVIKRFGLLTGLKLLNRRFYDCSWCNDQLKYICATQVVNNYKPYRHMSALHRKQGGFVDADCGGCDGIDFNGCDSVDPGACMPDMSSCTPDVGNCVPDMPNMDCSPSIPEGCAAESCQITDSAFDMCFWMNVTDSMCDSACYCVPDCCGSNRYNQQFKTRRAYRNSVKYPNLNKCKCDQENCEKDENNQCENCPNKDK